MSLIIGFAGLGNMGLPMAINMHRGLKAEGSSALRVWNRTASKADGLVAEGAVLATSLKSLAAECDIVFAMTFDDAALETLFAAFDAGASKPLTLVSCATVDPELIKRLAQTASKFVTLASSPVFGRPEAAAAKQLVAVLAGPSAACDAAAPFLHHTCRKITRLPGTNAHAANVLKLTGNFMILSMIDLLAQAQTLAECNGLARGDVVDVIASLFPGPIVGGYSERIARDEFASGFSVVGGLKDAGLVKGLAQRSGASVPYADVAYDHLVRQKEDGGAEMDWASLTQIVRKDSGL
ncbi:hypothetical protein BC830DRAFT_1136462 [Chytriomyces sp. MP71]|nr:hypothetical protein BC830DRAFT_1136462 [Chytriomyces sp. MP71]